MNSSFNTAKKMWENGDYSSALDYIERLPVSEAMYATAMLLVYCQETNLGEFMLTLLAKRE